MDFDLTLRKYLINNFEINKHESKKLFEYYNCKNKMCLIEGYTDKQYHQCINSCSEDFYRFQKLKNVIYKKIIQNYYLNYNTCLLNESNKLIDSCVNNLSNQEETISQVKKFIYK